MNRSRGRSRDGSPTSLEHPESTPRAHRTTLAAAVTLEGIGTHSGAPVWLALHPAAPGHGIAFRRTDATPEAPPLRADWRSVSATTLATVLGDPAAGGIGTVEHLLSALFGLEIDDVLAEVDGPELPILDGSASPFVAALDATGIAVSDVPREAIRILRPVRVEEGESSAELAPYEGRRFEVGIDFPEPAIGRQRIAFDLAPETYRVEIAPARTFGRLADVETLRAMGYAKGSSLANAVAVDGAHILNPEGLRFPDEFVRHKALDAIGDLALAGKPILGLYRCERGGHRLNQLMLRALFAAPEAFEIVRLVDGRHFTAPPDPL